jgi:hypothetical protein
MTIRSTLLARGYFPKELPPAFYTDGFAAFASSRVGRTELANYPPSNLTESVEYTLAGSGFGRRSLHIPHPVAYARLASIAAKSLGRLLKKAHRSPFARSKPSYVPKGARALLPMSKASNLPRERAISRNGAAFVVKADISHFYPSLYTHAVGWAIDAKLRNRAHWKNSKLDGFTRSTKPS